MNPTPSDNPPKPKRAKWLKRIVIAAVCLLLLAGIVAIGAWFYLRSEAFNRYVAEQIKIKLPDYGLSGEIGGFGITLDENRARLKDLKIHNRQTGQLIATLKSAEILFKVPDLYALKLSREVAIEKIALDGLELNVEIDEKGRSNFDGLRIAPPTQKAVTFDTRHLLTSVSNGAIHFKDRLRKIEAELSGLQADAQPTAENPDLVKLLCKAAAGRVSFEGREAALGPLDLVARVSARGAEVESLTLASSLGDVKAKGKLDDWSKLHHNFDVESKVKLDEAARMLGATVAVKGSATATLHVEGQTTGDKITGGVRADEIEAAGAKLRGLRIAGIRVDAKPDSIEFSSDRVTLQSAAHDTAKLGQIVLNDLKGSYKNGRTEIAAPAITVAGVEAPEARITAVRLRDLQINVADDGRYEATADAVAESAQIGDVKLSAVTAQALADNDDLVVSDIRGKIFSGEFEADYELPMAKNAASKLKASFSGIETKDAASLFETENLPVAGKVSGTVDVSIVGSNPRSLNGAIATHFEGKANEAGDAIPLTGDVLIRAVNGVFNFERAELATDASKLIASGKLSYDGDSDLRVSLQSSQAEQLVLIARSLEVARPFIEEYEPQLIGEFKLDGRITGNLEAATIEGDVSAATVGLRDAILGALAGHVVVSPSEVRIEKAVVNASNGGTLKFDLVSPLDKKAKTGTLSAIVDRISLETILAAAGAPNAEQFISGDVSGEAHLTGLPGTLEGTAEVSLIEGKIAGQPAETATAEVRFDGRDAFLEELKVKLPQSLLTATGSMNLDDYAFKLEGKADQIALDNLTQALELQQTKIEGSADAIFDVSGKVLVAGKKVDLDWESLKVELNARGRNVKVNGRDTGELQLTAETNPGGRLDAKLVTGILAGKPAEGEPSKAETIKASVELRKAGRPVVIESDLANLDLAPLLSLVAPDLVSTLTGTITGKLRIEGPSADANGNATLDLLHGGLTVTETNLLVADNPAKIETPATIALDSSRLSVPALRITGPGVNLDFSGAIGLKDESPMNFALKGQISLDRLPPFSPDLFLYGVLSVDARADGTAGEPRLGGKMEIAGFGLSSSNQPVFISDGEGTITLSGDQITLDKFTAKANDGTIEASGVTKLERFRPREWRYSIKANNAELVEQNIAATINGNLQLAGTPEGQLLSGTVSIPQAEYQPDIDFDNIATGGGGSLSFGSFSRGGRTELPASIPPINLNVRIEARDSLIIRNKQINTVGTGSLTLGGKLSDPDVDGRITLDGGTLRFRGQRYEITTGALDFPPGGGTALFNLVAEGELSGYRVYVGLVGQIDALDTTLRSEPELSRTEILSLVTTGRTEAGSVASQDPLISGVGAAASLITTGLISKPAEQLLGLSRFQIDPVIRPNSNPAARLTLGQQLSRNLYISYSTNLATEQDQTALAEYTLSNRFSTLATYTQGGSGTRQSVREGVFTIELRGRQRFSIGFRPEPMLSPGAPTEALDRILRPKLPPAEVKVSEVHNLKLSQKKLRELLPVMTQGFSRSLSRLGERRLLEYLQESGYFFAEVKSRCEPATCAPPALPNASPSPSASNNNLKVFYEIEPGVIYDLKDIRIEGTDILKLPAIQEYLQSQPANRLGKNPLLKDLPIVGGYVRGLTSNDRLKNDEEFIRNYLGDIGYRAARVKSRLAVKADNDDLIVVFDVDPGVQSEIAEVSVRGNAILPAPDLLQSVPVQPGEAFSYTRTRAGAQQIKQLYAQRGFLEADTNFEIIELADDRLKLIYDVNEGARAVVSEIEITGVTKTNKGWIRRYFDFKPGEMLTPAKIRQTQRDLYSTNAFREVNVRAEPIGGSSGLGASLGAGLEAGAAHRVTVNLTEAKPLLFVYGLGYSTDDGVRGLAEIANTNLGGTLDSLSLRLRGSRREQFSQLSFTDLRPFGTRFPTTISAFYNRNSNLIPFVRRRLVNGKEENSPDSRSFGLNRFAAFIQTERKLNERTSMRFRYNLERSSLFNIEAFPETEVTRNERAIRLGMFSVGISRDTRDSIINPTRGQLVSADHSIAANMFGGNESFNKFFASYQRYKTLEPYTSKLPFLPFLPFLKDTTLAFSARVGLASVFRDADRNSDGRISDSEKRLPISERFFSGGATTLRGFRFETAGPQGILEPRKDKPGELPTLVPLGGDALAIFNFELRYPLSSRLRLVPFYDFGNVFRRMNDFSFSRMTNTIGMGLRINTPLGPVGVDYGFLIDPPAYTSASGATLRQPRGAFHIRFGQTF